MASENTHKHGMNVEEASGCLEGERPCLFLYRFYEGEGGLLYSRDSREMGARIRPKIQMGSEGINKKGVDVGIPIQREMVCKP